MISINGKTYFGKSVSVNNGEVIVDGKRVTDHGAKGGVMTIKVIDGEVGNIVCDGSVNRDAATGGVRAGGSVNCDDVGGDVHAGGSVNCDDVGGNVSAGGSIRHG
jgi:hypothetical protein